MTKTNEPYSTGPIGNHQSNIIYRTHGRRHGLVTPLMSQSDLGEVLQPFAFLDLVNADAKALSSFALHPHSGIATLTHFFEGNVRHEDTTGAGGLLLEGGVEWFKAGHGAWHGGGESTRARGGFNCGLRFRRNMNWGQWRASAKHPRTSRDRAGWAGPDSNRRTWNRNPYTRRAALNQLFCGPPKVRRVRALSEARGPHRRLGGAEQGRPDLAGANRSRRVGDLWPWGRGDRVPRRWRYRLDPRVGRRTSP